MTIIKKIPDDPNTVVNDLNRVKEKIKLAELYGCTISGITSYCRRKGIKFVRTQPEWYIQEA